MDIYALQGPSNSGKTETIITFFNEIIRKYSSANYTKLHTRSRDIKYIITGIHQKIIGIESQGDPGSRLGKSLADFKSANCDIIFCACRPKPNGGTAMLVKALSPPYNIIFEPKNRAANNFQIENYNMAIKLMQLSGL